jgi:hypothetical protein
MWCAEFKKISHISNVPLNLIIDALYESYKDNHQQRNICVYFMFCLFVVYCGCYH